MISKVPLSLKSTIYKYRNLGRSSLSAKSFWKFLNKYTLEKASIVADQHPQTKLINTAFGNPDRILDGYTDIIQKCAIPENKNENDYYRYSTQERFIKERQFIADKLNKEKENHGSISTETKNATCTWTAKNIMLTNGAWSALYILFHTLLNENQEILYLCPEYFNYSMIVNVTNGTPKPVDIMNNFSSNSFSFSSLSNDKLQDIILASFKKSITNKTKIIILTTPNNPLGIIYSHKFLRNLSEILESKSIEYGHRIWIVSDEPYRDIIFDDNTEPFISPCLYYPYTLMTYSYAKILLTPQQRLGWIGISPLINKDEDELQEIFDGINEVQMSSGFQYPNVVPAKALIELEGLADKHRKGLVTTYQRNRDILYETLVDKLGFECMEKPKGAFYFFAKLPERYGVNDWEFVDKFFEMENALVLPGSVCAVEDWIRITFATGETEKIQELCQRFEQFDQFWSA